MPDYVTDDFAYIRERMDIIKKEQEEAIQQENNNSPTREQPPESESSENYNYCIARTKESLLGEYPIGYTLSYENTDRGYIEEYVWSGLCFRLNRIVYPISH
jgi:hypothetical protein